MITAMIMTTIRAYMTLKTQLKKRCHPRLGCAARIMRWAKIRFTTNRMRTPAATKICAAIARGTSVGNRIEINRSVVVAILAIEKPSDC